MPDGSDGIDLAGLQAWLQGRVTAGVWDLPEDPGAGPLAAEVVAGSALLPPRWTPPRGSSSPARASRRPPL
jgi:hypothetical protein